MTTGLLSRFFNFVAVGLEQCGLDDLAGVLVLGADPVHQVGRQPDAQAPPALVRIHNRLAGALGPAGAGPLSASAAFKFHLFAPLLSRRLK